MPVTPVETVDAHLRQLRSRYNAAIFAAEMDLALVLRDEIDRALDKRTEFARRAAAERLAGF